MADKTCSLLEFITFCFEKNEVMSIQHFAPEPPKEIPFGSHWPERLAILHKGCAVMVLVAAERDGPAWNWGGSDRDWEHVNASDDWTVLYDSTKQIFE